jgi:hypothetical protein
MNIRILVQILNLIMQPIQTAYIVPIHDGDIFSTSVRDSKVPGESSPSADAGSQYSDPLVSLPQFENSFCQATATRVYDDKEFEILECLVQNTVNCWLDISIHPVQSHDDADPRSPDVVFGVGTHIDTSSQSKMNPGLIVFGTPFTANCLRQCVCLSPSKWPVLK